MALSSCANDSRSLHINISKPHFLPSTGENERGVAVLVSPADLRYIADNEIYASVVVVSCKDKKQRYPTETYVGAMSLDDFVAVRAAAEQAAPNGVELRGVVPESFLLRVVESCVKLEGGGYSGRTVTSNTLKIDNNYVSD